MTNDLLGGGVIGMIISLKKKTRSLLFTLRWKFLSSLSLLALMAGTAVPAAAQTTTPLPVVTGNDFKPFSDRTLPGGGLATEILQAALSSQDVPVDLTWIAWDAGFDASARGEFAATLPYYYTDERAETHFYSAPIYSIDRLLFYRSDRRAAPADLAALAEQSVCVPVGYAVPPDLTPLIDAGSVTLEQPLDMTRCFELLQLEQVDFVVNHPLQGWDLVTNTIGLGPDNVQISDFILESNRLHIIVSKAWPGAETVLEQINAGLAAIRADGRYAALAAKHIPPAPGSEPAAATAAADTTTGTEPAGVTEPAETPALAAGDGAVTHSLELTDGSRLVGEIIEADDNQILIATSLGEIAVPRDSIVSQSIAESAEEITAEVVSATESPTSPPARSLTLAGSNTIGASLAPQLVELFAGTVPGSLTAWQVDAPNEQTALFEGGGPTALQRVSVRAHGSSTGFAALGDGSADLAMASRPIKAGEVAALAGLGDMQAANAEHVLALDGLAVIVHPDNPVELLSRAQIAAIYDGTITNWREIDPANPALPDQAIEVLARDAQSGTFDSFTSLVLGAPDRLRPDAEQFDTNPELADQVAARPAAIGFTGLGQIRNAKALNIDECGIAAAPDPFTVKAEEYPLARRLYLYRPPSSTNPWSGPLIEFAASNDGQAVIEDEGFIGLTIAPRAIAQSDAFWADIENRPRQVAATIDEIKKVTNGAQRLTSTFRFRTASATLDARALRDLRRLARYIRTQEIAPSRLILAGFADGRGGYDTNRALSLRRAQTVAAALAAEGLEVAEVYGFSEELPVACDTDERGWALNRRVEVWLKP